MKYILIAAFLLLGKSSYSQDTLYLKEGDTIYCQLRDVNVKEVTYTLPGKQTLKTIDTKRLKQAKGTTYELVFAINSMVAPEGQTYRKEQETVSPSLSSTVTPTKGHWTVGRKIELSGGLLIGASALTLVGVTLSVVGATQDIPGLTYAGAGAGGLSIFLYLGAGVNLKKAGSQFQKL